MRLYEIDGKTAFNLPSWQNLFELKIRQTGFRRLNHQNNPKDSVPGSAATCIVQAVILDSVL